MRARPAPLPAAVPQPLSGSDTRLESFRRRLDRLASAIEVLNGRLDRLGRRERGQCRYLLNLLELRALDAEHRLASLVAENPRSGKAWNQLQESCAEIEEHLGFLAQMIRNRTNSRNRPVRGTPPPPGGNPDEHAATG